jgi:hypothetical protein
MFEGRTSPAAARTAFSSFFPLLEECTMAEIPTRDRAVPRPRQRERGFQAVIDRGYDRADVDLVMSDATRSRHFGSTPDGRTTELGTKAAEVPASAARSAARSARSPPPWRRSAPASRCPASAW